MDDDDDDDDDDALNSLISLKRIIKNSDSEYDNDDSSYSLLSEDER